MADCTRTLLENSVNSSGIAAMLLALTQTIYDEEKVKQIVAKNGFKAVVTEVGGRTSFDDFNEKINRAVIGASLNSGVIQKTTNDIHALIHATEERIGRMQTGSSVSISFCACFVQYWTW